MWRYAINMIKWILVENLHWNNYFSMKSTCDFEANFPPQVYLENDKSSLGVDGSHYYNIFF